MEKDPSNEPTFRHVSSADILFDLINNAGPDGLAFHEVTTLVDLIKAERAKRDVIERINELPITTEPGLPDAQEIEAVVRELLDTGRIAMKGDRIYTVESKNNMGA